MCKWPSVKSKASTRKTEKQLCLSVTYKGVVDDEFAVAFFLVAIPDQVDRIVPKVAVGDANGNVSQFRVADDNPLVKVGREQDTECATHKAC